MTDFLTLSHTSSSEIPTLVLLLKLENGTHTPVPPLPEPPTPRPPPSLPLLVITGSTLSPPFVVKSPCVRQNVPASSCETTNFDVSVALLEFSIQTSTPGLNLNFLRSIFVPRNPSPSYLKF